MTQIMKNLRDEHDADVKLTAQKKLELLSQFRELCNKLTNSPAGQYVNEQREWYEKFYPNDPEDFEANRRAKWNKVYNRCKRFEAKYAHANRKLLRESARYVCE